MDLGEIPPELLGLLLKLYFGLLQFWRFFRDGRGWVQTLPSVIPQVRAAAALMAVDVSFGSVAAAALMAGVGSNPCRHVFLGASELPNLVTLGFFVKPLYVYPVSLRGWETLVDGVISSSSTWPRSGGSSHAPLISVGDRGGWPWSLASLASDSCLWVSLGARQASFGRLRE